ncbi:MAG: hypothetical protein WBY44_24195 [Bryobacteraceae bacterium]
MAEARPEISSVWHDVTLQEPAVIARSHLRLDLLHIEPLLGETLVGGGLMAILEVRPPDFPAMSLARRERVGDPIGKECRNIPS